MKIPLKLLLTSFSEFVAPRHCIVCNEYLGVSERRFEFFCDKCFDSIPLAPEPDYILNRLVSYYSQDELAISEAVSLMSVSSKSDFMELIYSLKYYGFSKIGIELGRELGRRLIIYGKGKYDIVVPVPIHTARMRERGYNQSEFIARGISSVIESKVANKVIKRVKYTQTQTQLSSAQRRKNVENVFEPYHKNLYINGQNILLIDDVLTTGSTLNCCAKLLLEMGACNVDVATVAYAES
ncbi:MAG: ComF family protein [FCB group bacterium]